MQRQDELRNSTTAVRRISRMCLTPDKRGGLNGSTQHQLEVHLREPRTLKSFASVKSDKNTTLYRFNEYKPASAVHYGETLSNQPIRGCCIDRLSWQR